MLYIKSSKRNYLKNLDEKSYLEFCKIIISFDFCDRILKERRAYSSDKEFMNEIWFKMLTGKLNSPISQSVHKFNTLIKASPEERYKLVDKQTWLTYVSFTNCKTKKDFKNFYDREFLEELIAIKECQSLSAVC